MVVDILATDEEYPSYVPPSPQQYEQLAETIRHRCSLILASSSKHRQQLLRDIAVPFTCHAVPVDEGSIQKWFTNLHPKAGAAELTLLLSHIKADATVCALAKHHKEIWPSTAPGDDKTPPEESGRLQALVACDSLVEFLGEVRAKPKSADEAKEFLSQYSSAPNAPVECFSGCVVANLFEELRMPPCDPRIPLNSEGRDKCQACEMLVEMGRCLPEECRCTPEVGHAARVYRTGLSNYRRDSRVGFVCRSEVFFHPFSEAEAEEVSKSDAAYCNGCVMIDEGMSADHVKRIRGCPQNVIGIPLRGLENAIRQLVDT